MDDQDILNGLSSLTKREREVLGLRCQRHKYIVIARKLNPTISEDGVKAQMHNVYVKLGLIKVGDIRERHRLLFEVICPALTRLPETSKSEPEAEPLRLLPAPIGVMALVTQDDDIVDLDRTPTGLILSPRKSIQVIDNAKPPERVKQAHPLRWMVLGMLLGTLLVGAIAWAAVKLITDQTPNVEPTQLAQATFTPVVVKEEVTVVVTQQSLVTQLVVVSATPQPASPTPQPTETPSVPTETPLSTVTATSAVTFPFEDNFDSDIDPRWKILSGDFIVTEGKLGTVSDSTTVEIGDNSWSNYTVDFDYVRICSIYFIVAQQIRYSMCEGDWEAFSNNQWDRIADGERGAWDGHLRLVVSGNSYTIFIKGVKFYDIKYGQPLSGPFAIVIGYQYSFVDNVVITSP